MEISIVGAGPAGLFLAILLRRRFPQSTVKIFEKNAADTTWGWGVVFSEETLGNIRKADPESFEEIENAFVRWDAIDVHFGGKVIRSGGHDFAGIRRSRLLEILQKRAQALGVELHFSHEVTDQDFENLRSSSDLVVAADGVHSRIRKRFSETFEPQTVVGLSKYIWLGSNRDWEAFTFLVKKNEFGVFQVHAYPFERGEQTLSTFIVECDEESWRKAGLDNMSDLESVEFCEKLFAEELDGASLFSNHSRWISFPTLRCRRWHHENVLLLGDSAHTAHFSIGSGTKMAMEDAIFFVESLSECTDLRSSLEDYHQRRWLDVAKLQRSAGVSQKWFEDISRYVDFEPEAFSCSLMSRSKRVTYENLRLRDPDYVGRLDRWYAEGQSGPLEQNKKVAPPMFQPFKLREIELTNRLVLSPMCQYSADEGAVGDWHLVHLGSRAVGGAGLLIAEMTAVSEEGRISPGCAGIYRDEHIDAWRRIVDFIHNNSAGKIGLQLGHAGRKGSTRRMWEGMDQPIADEQANWPLFSASAIPWTEKNQTPSEMSRTDMDKVVADFVSATQRAEAAGFDLLEIHFAHGYLLSSFISPLSNQRSDEYGGRLANRMRFPLEVFEAVRKQWPDSKPISVRVSATDWLPGGLSEQDLVELARALKERECDLIDVSAGQTVAEAKPVYGRMFQTPFSDLIRNEVGIPTIAVGNIQGWDHVNTILASGRADLCAIARPHLYNPYLALHSAAEQGFPELIQWPLQYESGASVAQRVAQENETKKNDE